MNQEIKLNEFQRRLLELPEEVDLALLGGRGGGKSFAMALLALRHCAQYGDKARVLLVRKTLAGLRDFELVCRELFGMVHGDSARYNSTEGTWKFSNGAFMELGHLSDHTDYQVRYQGRSFTLMMADEIGAWANPDILDLLRSNLRGPKDVPLRMIVAGNPGGIGHGWSSKRYVFAGNAPWKPFIESKSKRTWVYCPSTFADNDLIDREQYKTQLESACPNDKALLDAWLNGNWAISRGSFFESAIAEDRNAVDPLANAPDWPDTWLCHDFGSAAPSATFIMALSPGDTHEGKFYPRGSVLIFAELVTSRPDAPHIGLGWTADELGREIVKMCQLWGVPARGVADDSIFSKTGSSSGSIADEFAKVGVKFAPAKKAGRVAGWQVMKRFLADAGKPDRAGLYVTRDCTAWWESVPNLTRDPRRLEDVDSTGNDHAADSTRYGLMRFSRQAKIVTIRGLV